MEGPLGDRQLAFATRMKSMLIDWPAPAKLNLFLHVLGRREDGYHRLQTLFQFVDLHDRIRMYPREDGRILRHGGLAGLNPEQDLTVRAARALQAHTQCPFGSDIEVEKYIPAGGGLGGGSSDAATVLLALNQLWDLNLGRDELAALGLRLGADVPIFIHGQAAWAEGVGERLTPIPDDIELDQPWRLILHPGCSVSTAEVFSNPKLTRNTAAITIRAFLSGEPDVPRRNDLEAVVRTISPEVGSALDWLARQPGVDKVAMTGSGACVFGSFADCAAAQRVAGTVPARWRAFITRGRNRSPLHEMLDRAYPSAKGIS